MNHKFRAWDEIKKKYEKNINITLDGIPVCIGQCGNLKWEGVYDRKLILEQFTGFTDSEGVEIYEGDICRATISKQEAYDSNLITEDTGNCEIKWSDEKGQWWFWGWASLATVDESYPVKIIGNCHEVKK